MSKPALKPLVGILLAVAVVLVVPIVAIAATLGGETHASEATGEMLSSQPGSGAQDGEAAESGAASVSVAPGPASATPEPAVQNTAYAPYRAFYFYEDARAERYVAYHAAHPEQSAEQVVIAVNLDLDSGPYELVSEARDPTSLTALVNKHFYLPEGYRPGDLVPAGTTEMRAEAAGHLAELTQAAAAEGIYFTLGSAYRDAGYQASLYYGYEASMGTEWADLQSARPGFSEHQTGLCIDFNPTNYLFYDTPQAAWLEANVHRFGFIVRYREGLEDTTLYIHEPWHIRYVGAAVAATMHNEGIGAFEEYWVKYIQHSPPAGGAR